MDIKKKMKIESFSKINFFNFPKELDLGIHSAEGDIEVIMYYIDRIGDVEKFVNLCNQSRLPKENRTILVFKKGRKDDLNRDSIIMPFRSGKYDNFKFRAPMLCSISKELSAFVLSKVEK